MTDFERVPVTEPLPAYASSSEKTGDGRWANVGRSTRKAAEMMNRQAKAAGEYSASQVRAKPVRSLAIAVGAGMILGALLFA